MSASARTSEPGERTAAGRRPSFEHETGLTLSEISRIERGVREPRLTTLVRLVAGLEIDPADLFDGVPIASRQRCESRD